MPVEVVDLLKEGLDDMRQAMASLADDHKQTAERLTKLEFESRVTRWVFAVCGGCATLVVREFIGGLF